MTSEEPALREANGAQNDNVGQYFISLLGPGPHCMLSRRPRRFSPLTSYLAKLAFNGIIARWFHDSQQPGFEKRCGHFPPWLCLAPAKRAKQPSPQCSLRRSGITPFIST